ncbi:MAG TPA: hypothetical protein VD927_08065 [Chryseosolibacter sp.]|nr:hypothetical protein [Chryseosolibacter sp.]
MLLACSMAYAQSSSLLMGGRTMGLGYSSATLNDEWSLMNNVAGLSGVENLSASFAFHSYPGFKPFNRSALIINAPVKKGAAAFGIFRFGDEIYREQVASIGYSNKFGLASLGVKINFVQYAAEGFGSTGVLTFNFGGIAHLTDELLIGAYVTNINQPEITSVGEKKFMPTRMNLGIAFNPSEKIMLAAEAEHDLDHETLFKGGFEYRFQKKFVGRTGFNINPDAGFLGLGFTPKRFHLDYAFQYNIQIGMSHQLSITYNLAIK